VAHSDVRKVSYAGNMVKIRRTTTRAAWPRARDLIARFLVGVGVSPNAVTVLGTLGAVVGAVGFAARGQLITATIIITLCVFGDLVDGAMARASHRESRFGALLDSVLDRVADGAIFGSLAYWLFSTGLRRAGAAALICIVMGQLVSYVRARAEAIGFRGEIGIAHRFARLKLIGIGGLLGGLGLLSALEAVLWLLAALSTITVAQRIAFTHRQIKAAEAATVGPVTEEL
jgi:CDP-diacylglycerol--glycerol-3-phosphate 3-phosphatidyltransferase